MLNEALSISDQKRKLLRKQNNTSFSEHGEALDQGNIGREAQTMSEISLTVGSRNLITIRMEPNNVQGRDLAGHPALYLPLQIQLQGAGQQGDVPYTLIALTGKLLSLQSREFASLDVGLLAEVPSQHPFFRQQEALVSLDHRQIKQFEDAQAGNDARFQVMLSGLLWFPSQQKFEVSRSTQQLDVVVPWSHWIDKVISAWNIHNIKLIEIEFPKSVVGENFRTSYARVEEAERLFANGQYKQVLTTLRLSFEALANSLGFERRIKDCFDSLFSSFHPDKKEKARDALMGIYKFLHLGPHEQADHANPNVEPVVLRQDARFSLTLAYAIFEYIAPSG